MANVNEKFLANGGDEYLRKIFGDMKTAQQYIIKYPLESVLKISDNNSENQPTTHISAVSRENTAETEGCTNGGGTRHTQRPVDHRNSISEESSEWEAPHSHRSQTTNASIKESSTISSSLTHSKLLAVQAKQTSQWDLYKYSPDRYSPDSSHSPAVVASDQGPSNCPPVSSAQSTDTLLGTPSSMQEQTERNTLPDEASFHKQSSENKSLRRSKRKVTHRSSRSEEGCLWGDQISVEKLSKTINRRVKDLQGRSQVVPEKDESVGKWEERVIGESKEPVLSNDAQQTLQGQIQTEVNESVTATDQIATVKRRRTTTGKGKSNKLSKDGERAVKVSLREDERSANKESKGTTFGQIRTTQNARAVKPKNIVERGEQITMGNCSTDQGRGSEEGIQRAMASGTDSLKCSDRTLNFDCRRNSIQLQISDIEIISIEDRGESGSCDDLTQHCHEEMRQSRAREHGTSQQGSYSQQSGGIQSEVYQHKDRRGFQITESEREILENKIESRSDKMHHINCSPYQERKSCRQQNLNCPEKETDMQQKDYSYYNAGQCCNRKSGSTEVKRKPLSVFNRKVPECKAVLGKSYHNKGYLQHYLTRDQQQLTRGSLRTIQLELENSRLRKEVISLRAKLAEISDAVQGARDAYTDISDESESEEDDSSVSDMAVEDDGEEYRSCDNVRFPCNTGENDQLCRLYEANMRQSLKSIRGKSRPRKTLGSITKRYRKNAGPKFPRASFTKSGNHPNLRSFSGHFSTTLLPEKFLSEI